MSVQAHPLETILVQELVELTGELGAGGGRISPSVYATARALHDAPPAEGAQETARWLVDMQASDGGWGQPLFPWQRMAPTLAAVRALRRYEREIGASHAILAGLEFVRAEAPRWNDDPPDQLPVAAELIVPTLVDELVRDGLDLPVGDFMRIRRIGDSRLAAIRGVPVLAGSAPTFCWEAWGVVPRQELLDGTGGVGTSPAATAAWLSRAPEPSVTRIAPLRYLELARAATGCPVPGVVPFAWPIERFEQSWGAHSLLGTGIGRSLPGIKTVVDALAAAMTPDGVGWSDALCPDADDTAVTLAVLAYDDRSPNISALDSFRQGVSFATFPGERNPSVSALAHCVQALALAGRPDPTATQRLIDLQEPDGRWSTDKWHLSWTYVTGAAGQALIDGGAPHATDRAVAAVIQHQHADGGWGTGAVSTPLETSYAVLFLEYAHRARIGGESSLRAMTGARQFLLNNALTEVGERRTPERWIGTEPYSVPRVDRIHELCALLLLLGQARD